MKKDGIIGIVKHGCAKSIRKRWGDKKEKRSEARHSNFALIKLKDYFAPSVTFTVISSLFLFT